MENEDEIRQEARSFEGLKISFGGFEAEVMDDLSLKISTSTGWALTYPLMSESWGIMTYWMNNWDEEECRNCMENFVKMIVYPISLRLSDIDVEYLQGLMEVQKDLNDRIAARQEEPEEAEGQRILDRIRQTINKDKS